MTNEKIKLIIDTDPGHDDAMAILMLLANPNIDIRTITTVAGNSTIENTTRNARYILKLAKNKTIPVFDGAAKPLNKKLILADVHGASGLDGSETLSLGSITLENNATDRIIELVNSDPGKITILALGPLTNIAQAFLKDPKLFTKIKQLIIMGGAIGVCGNKSRVAEFNFFVDPEAAKIVLETNIEKILIPLDACKDIFLADRDIVKIKNGPIGYVLKQMLKPYIKNLALFDGLKGAMMYDPLAAYYLVNPQAFSLQKADIVVETKGEFTAGMSVIENRAKVKKLFNVLLTTKIDRSQFIKDFIASINTLDNRKEASQ